MPRNRPARLALAAALVPAFAGRSAHGESPMPSIKPEMTMILVTHDVEEAIYLGDRVLVMQSHPGRITREIALDLPRPRDRASLPFTEIRQQILRDMGAVAALAA